MNAEDSIRKIVPAVSALPQLAECLVLMFLYERRNGRFVLVTDYPDRAVGSDRTFASLTFGGVVDFERECGNVERYSQFSESYRIREGAPLLVVQDVHVAGDDGGGRVRFWFGPNFGGVQFRYGDLAVLVRDSRVLERDNTFSYLDLKSGEKFEFGRPFPDLFWPNDQDT